MCPVAAACTRRQLIVLGILLIKTELCEVIILRLRVHFVTVHSLDFLFLEARHIFPNSIKLNLKVFNFLIEIICDLCFDL